MYCRHIDKNKFSFILYIFDIILNNKCNLGGLCRNAVPALPGMRWKSVAASLDTDTVVVCGGINFLGTNIFSAFYLSIVLPKL